MTVYFFDTSALVKRYAREFGTDWVRRITDPGYFHEIYIVRVTGAETVATFFRKIRTNEWDSGVAVSAMDRFKRDFNSQYRIIDVTADVIAMAMDLIQKHGLRGYDSVQLAAALELNNLRRELGMPSMTFVCSDNNLNMAAESESLIAEDPAIHT